jgi:4a-hydroxytetrahydrobiopterin dehydratase
MWQNKNNTLYKKFEFTDFKAAFRFMQNVAEVAERENHHPKWLNEWKKVEIWLTTHELGDKVTDKDYKMAKLIDEMKEEIK